MEIFGRISNSVDAKSCLGEFRWHDAEGGRQCVSAVNKVAHTMTLASTLTVCRP